MKFNIFLASILALSLNAVAFVPTTKANADEAEQQPGPEVIQAIQTLLKSLGYQPGTPDGRLGPRTVEAIRAYQRRSGLVVDGDPSETLLIRLTAEVDARTTPAARSPESAPATGIPLIGTTWEFIDANGSIFRGRFEAGGSFIGPGDLRFWTWELSDNGLKILYDNGMGVRIERNGRFVDSKWLNGSAETSTGRRWDWVANRITGGMVKNP